MSARSTAVIGIALVLGILGFLIFMGGYDIYSHPLRGISFWEYFFGWQYLSSKVGRAYGLGITMMGLGILLMGASGLILISEHQKAQKGERGLTNYCPACGTRVQYQMRFCPNCGKRLA